MKNKILRVALSSAFMVMPQTVLAEEEIELKSVEVTAKRIADDIVRSSSTATKTDTPLMETPVSVQVIPETVLTEQNAMKVGDAVRNVSGVQAEHFYGGSSERFLVRGFLQSTAGFRNGVRVPLRKFDLANVQSVEVLKGPASMLYGPSDPSGIINLVTKKPQKEAAYSIEQSIGSYDNFRTEAGATGAIDDDGILTYRLDAVWQQANSYRDIIETDRYFVAPALGFRPDDKTEINLSIEPQRDRGVYDVGQPAVGDHLANIPRSRSFNQHDIETYKSVLIDFNGSHIFDSGWKVAGGVFNSKQDNDLHDIYIFGRLQEADTDISRNFWVGKEKIKTRNTWLNLTGDVETGSIKHTLLFGAERLTSSYDQATRDRFIDFVNIYQPQHNPYVDAASLLGGDIDVFSDHKTKTNSFYAQDQLRLNAQWQLLLGARYDKIEQDLGSFYYSPLALFERTDSKTSPRVGILYQPIQQLSLFANCAKSFGTTFNYEASALYKPEEAKQCEVGAKTELADGRINASVAYYDLTKTNIPTTDPTTPGRTVAIGEANSRGLEFDIQGQITDNLSMIASYAYTDTEITKDGSGNEGNRLPYAPRNQYSLWLNYSLQGTTLDGLTVGGGVFGASQRYGDAENSYGDDSYAKIDLYTAYRFKLNQTKMTAQLNINNVTNEKFYYLRSVWSNLPSEPASVMATLRVDF